MTTQKDSAATSSQMAGCNARVTAPSLDELIQIFPLFAVEDQAAHDGVCGNHCNRTCCVKAT
jgi:hypothetical protein